MNTITKVYDFYHNWYLRNIITVFVFHVGLNKFSNLVPI